MFLQKRVVNGITYTYIDHSFRIGNKIKKASFIIAKDKIGYNEKIIQKIATDRAKYFKENFQTYFTLKEIVEIETEKVFYQIFFNLLEEKNKKEIFSEFVRLFLANSMELEGSTITPKLADSIDKKKRIVLPELDIHLYNNSKKSLFRLMQSEFRSIVQFKRLHEDIYRGIYSHAGKFKKQINTFGYLEKALTSLPNKIRNDLKETLKKYKDRKVYPFLRPLIFHLNYQKVHPFIDGNSRLGRILLVVQMLQNNYPPLIFKGDMNFQIRETLVEYCNHQNFDFCRLSMEQYLKTSKTFWRPTIQKFLFHK